MWKILGRQCWKQFWDLRQQADHHHYSYDVICWVWNSHVHRQECEWNFPFSVWTHDEFPLESMTMCLRFHFKCNILVVIRPYPSSCCTCRLRILMLSLWVWPSITSHPGLITGFLDIPLPSLPSSVEYRGDTTRTMAIPYWYTAVLVWVGRAPSSCWTACWRGWRWRTLSTCTSFCVTWGPRGSWWYKHW